MLDGSLAAPSTALPHTTSQLLLTGMPVFAIAGVLNRHRLRGQRTSVLPDLPLSAPLKLPCCSEMILAQFQGPGVN